MKTLDEVIFEAPYSPTPWEADALHYLKEHKNTDENYKKAIEHVIEVIDHYEKMVADYLSVNNPPLTWDELKQMEGKPVWVEGCGYSHGFWVIIDYFSGGEVFTALDGKCDQFWKQDMTDENNGDSWQAYRKERRFE